MGFIQYLESIEQLKRNKKYDEAHELSQKWLKELRNTGEEDWFMLYYQISDIYKKQKDYKNSLIFFWYMLFYLWRYWGATHEKIILSLLKKYWKNDIQYFLDICKSSKSEIEVSDKIIDYIN